MLASAIFCNLGVRSAGGLTPLVSAILVKIFEASLVLALEISQRGDSGSRVQEKRRKTRGATETILINLQEAINQPERENTGSQQWHYVNVERKAKWFSPTRGKAI